MYVHADVCTRVHVYAHAAYSYDLAAYLATNFSTKHRIASCLF